MPSPFPWMNPFLEQPTAWKDFDSRFIQLAAERIGRQIMPRYFVKIDEHGFVHDSMEGEQISLGRPDLAMVPGEEPGNIGPGGLALLAPARVGMPVFEEVERWPFLEIIDSEKRQVVTVLELLSPSHKRSTADRRQYLAKVKGILESEANFVEIDLLRGGPRMPWVGLPKCDYCIVVSRHTDRLADPAQANVWPLRLHDPLPVVPIPLRDGDSEPTLDLQDVLQSVYDSAGYQFFIYKGEPEPRLRPEDEGWAKEFLTRSAASV